MKEYVLLNMLLIILGGRRIINISPIEIEIENITHDIYMQGGQWSGNTTKIPLPCLQEGNNERGGNNKSHTVCK